MKIEKEIPLLEAILGEWKEKMGIDYQGYKNHVYRMLHITFYLHNPNEDEKKKLIIAGAFHDIGIWSDGTVDYLPPSIVVAEKYLKDNNLEKWIEEITLIIDLHHKIRPVKNKKYPLIESFRKGDLADFSLGFIRNGVPKSYIKELKSIFPNAGFHKMLLKLTWKQIKKSPSNPAPMMKW